PSEKRRGRKPGTPSPSRGKKYKRNPKKWITKPCAACGKRFTSYKRDKKKFCSIQCSGTAQRTVEFPTEHVCLVCGAVFTPHPNARGRQKFCSIACCGVSLRTPKNGRPTTKLTRVEVEARRLHQLANPPEPEDISAYPLSRHPCEICRHSFVETNLNIIESHGGDRR